VVLSLPVRILITMAVFSLASAFPAPALDNENGPLTVAAASPPFMIAAQPAARQIALIFVGSYPHSGAARGRAILRYIF
jgi:hypothetical protein